MWVTNRAALLEFQYISETPETPETPYQYVKIVKKVFLLLKSGLSIVEKTPYLTSFI